MSGSSSENELMLYHVLERANLAQYYDAFISQGGDDLYQLCEAGEEEFLEIMVLVGMSKKPLHVRRLQKALHEWATNPALFRDTDGQRKRMGQLGIAAKGSILAAFLQHAASASGHSKINSAVTHPLVATPGGGGGGGIRSLDLPPTPLATSNGLSRLLGDAGFPEHSFRLFQAQLEGNSSAKPGSPVSENSDQDSSMNAFINNSGEKVTTSPAPFTGAVLMDTHVKKIERTASEISQTLPYYAPKPLNMKKPIDKEIDEAMNFPEDDPNRMDLFRKYSAIYGRFDSKRRGGKQMNFHEMCINEAAAQLCKHRPSLLTRREELFILARQVVREAGFQYSKGFRSKESTTSTPEEPPSKVMKHELGKMTAARDLSFSKHKFLLPASVSLGSLQDETEQYADVCPNGNLATDGIGGAGGRVSDLLLRQQEKGLVKNNCEWNKAQQSPVAPRKIVSVKHESESGSRAEELDEQRQWQREVGLDSLQIALIHSRRSVLQGTSVMQGAGATQGTSATQGGSSIVQALREGTRGLRTGRGSSVGIHKAQKQ